MRLSYSRFYLGRVILLLLRGGLAAGDELAYFLSAFSADLLVEPFTIALLGCGPAFLAADLAALLANFFVKPFAVALLRGGPALVSGLSDRHFSFFLCHQNTPLYAILSLKFY